MLSPQERQNLKASIVDVANQMQVIADRRAAVKDVIKGLSDKYNINKKTLSQMAKAYFNNSFEDMSAESEEFMDIYSMVFQGSIQEEDN